MRLGKFLAKSGNGTCPSLCRILECRLQITKHHLGLSIVATFLAQFWTILAHIVCILREFHGNRIGAIVVATLRTAETQFRVSLAPS